MCIIKILMLVSFSIFLRTHHCNRALACSRSDHLLSQLFQPLCRFLLDSISWFKTCLCSIDLFYMKYKCYMWRTWRRFRWSNTFVGQKFVSREVLCEQVDWWDDEWINFSSVLWSVCSDCFTQLYQNSVIITRVPITESVRYRDRGGRWHSKWLFVATGLGRRFELRQNPTATTFLAALFLVWCEELLWQTSWHKLLRSSQKMFRPESSAKGSVFLTDFATFLSFSENPGSFIIFYRLTPCTDK